MLVLHAWWGLDDVLVCWAERDPAGYPGEPARRPAHPFAADADELAVSCTTASPQATGLTERTVLLPTVAGRPVPSPEAAAPDPLPPARSGPRPGTWRVPTVELAPAQALDVLLAGPGAPGDVVLAGTWRHLREVARVRGRPRRPRPGPAGGDHPAGLSAGPPGLGRAGACGGRWSPARTPSSAVARARPAARGLARPAGRSGSRLPLRSSPPQVDALTDAACGTRLSASGVVAPADPPGWPRSPLPATGTLTPARARCRPGRRAGALAAGGGGRARPGTVPPGRTRAPRYEPGGLVGERAVDARVRAAGDRASRACRRRRAGLAAPGRLQALARLVAAPQATLLAELGRASRLYPELDEALRAAPPEGSCWTPRARTRSCARRAPVLAAAGFGVELPGWWRRPSARLGARLERAAADRAGHRRRASAARPEALVDYRWEVALGRRARSTPRSCPAGRAAAAPGPAARAVGGARSAPARRGLKLLAEPPAPAHDPRRAARARRPRGRGPGRAAGARRRGRGLARRPAVRARRRPARAGRPAPRGFTGTLRPYQERGLAWLAFLDGSGSAASSPTTWAWARPSSCSRWRP